MSHKFQSSVSTNILLKVSPLEELYHFHSLEQIFPPDHLCSSLIVQQEASHLHLIFFLLQKKENHKKKKKKESKAIKITWHLKIFMNELYC